MKKIIKVLLIAFLFRLIISFITWHPDLNNHIDWGIRFWEYGPKMFFAPSSNVWSFTWPNQPPITILTFALIRKLYELIYSIFWFINIKVPMFPSALMFLIEKNLYPSLLKLPSILSDLGIGFLIFKFFQDEKKEKVGLIASIVYLFNPVIWYNSAIWGQTDAYINFFALLAFYLLFKRKLVLASLAFVTSLYIKVSLIIFLPIFLIIVIRQKYTVKKLLFSLFSTLILIVIPTIPFTSGNPLFWLFDLYQNKVLGQQLQIITANAFNLWSAIAGIHELPHTLLLGPLSYKLWGQILFTLFYIPALFHIYKKQDTKTVIYALALVAFSSFMLLTNMHERYLFPLFPYLTMLVFWDKKLMPVLAGVSIINLLNLYNFWWFPKIDIIMNFLSFNNRLMPRILGVIDFGFFIYFYSKFLRLLKLARL
jgi:Gpi18-like mannosyltransferase